jgi:hypothetical protein
VQLNPVRRDVSVAMTAKTDAEMKGDAAGEACHGSGRESASSNVGRQSAFRKKPRPVTQTRWS